MNTDVGPRRRWWSQWEVEYLTAYYRVHTDAQIATHLDRPANAVRRKRHACSLLHDRGGHPTIQWDDTNTATLITMCEGGSTNAQIAIALGFTEVAIRRKREDLGLDAGASRRPRGSTRTMFASQFAGEGQPVCTAFEAVAHITTRLGKIKALKSRRDAISKRMQAVADHSERKSYTGEPTQSDYQWERLSHFYRDVNTAIDQLSCGYEEILARMNAE